MPLRFGKLLGRIQVGKPETLRRLLSLCCITPVLTLSFRPWFRGKSPPVRDLHHPHTRRQPLPNRNLSTSFLKRWKKLVLPTFQRLRKEGPDLAMHQRKRRLRYPIYREHPYQRMRTRQLIPLGQSRMPPSHKERVT